jgi:hypothetical protein
MLCRRELYLYSISKSSKLIIIGHLVAPGFSLRQIFFIISKMVEASLTRKQCNTKIVL